MDLSRTSPVLVTVVALAVAFSLVSVPLSCDAKHAPKKPHHFQFFWHDTLQNTTHPWTDTAQEVAGPNHNLTGLGFGKVIVFNDTLTLGPSSESAKLGLGQGTYIYDRTQAGIAFNSLLVFTALIETSEVTGTLNFMGADVILAPTRDISIVGGTGDFELARGIATLVTHSIDGSTFIVNVTSRLYY